MSISKANLSLSICSTNSISIFPYRDQNSQRLFSDDLLHFLIDEKVQGSQDKGLSVLKETYADEGETERQFSSIDESAPSIRSESSVMCINCYDTVEIELIDQHSLLCVKPVTGNLKVQEKLKAFLNWVREMRVNCREIYVYPLILLEDITKKSLDSKNEIYSSFERLNLVLEEFQKLPIILLAAQRLSLLLENLSGPNSSKNFSNTLQIDFLDPIPNTSKVNQESFFSSFSDCSDIFKPCLSPSGSPETLEKFFYSLCIKAKLEAPNKKLPPVGILFQQCQEKSIPIEQWRSFIDSSFL